MITKVYISPFNNIFQNLCLEDYLLRQAEEELVLFYINEPCVVLGNFQNPWAETSPKLLAQKNVALARRQSGGGTVYHDEGNLNFCIFRNKGILSEGDKDQHLNLFRNFLSKQMIETDKLPKSGMVYKTSEGAFKFSGEAFKQISKRSFHHGTLLINSNLQNLKDCLTPALGELDSKAVASNPYRVGNLSSVWEGINVLSFIEQFIKFHGLLIYNPDFSRIHLYVNEHASDWATREQVLGKTPEFEVCHSGKKLTVKNAQIVREDDSEVGPRDFSA